MERPPADELVRALTADGSASVRVLTATNLVREAVRRHRTSPAASVALGRALMGTLLLATEARDGERVQLQVRGDGPFGRILADADSEGAVRGTLQHPGADPPLRGESLGVAEGVGSGVLSVERNHPSWRQPYSGIVPIATGEIAQDLARYLLESEQKPSAVVLGIYLDPGGGVGAAAGYLIQALPGAGDAPLAELERRVADTPHPSELARRGLRAEALTAHLLGRTDAGVLGRVRPRFRCRCNVDRVRRAAVLLGREEIRDMVRRAEPLEVTCAFCADVYRVAPEEVAALMPDG